MAPDSKTPDLGDEALVARPSVAPKPSKSEVADHISRHLRLIYDAVASQPIPDRFLQLLDQLDERTRGE